ncbi:C-type Lectin CRL-like [Gigantopelta aegis]|uniref:C-type Lectin CRL-like n=1 Tax=Gigantopelta aegis TaxID=1735272 RepID=UPI001B88DB62|nr:C-type Lectin CRL-like [Gigantopelta aegis]
MYDLPYFIFSGPDCPNPPVFADSYQQFNPSSVSTAYGETLKYGCNSGFVAENGVTTIRCGVDATWTSIVCKHFCQVEGYRFIKRSGMCVKIAFDKKTWFQAKEACESDGGRLAKIDTEDKALALSDILVAEHPGNPFYVGASDLRKANSWEWTDGTAVEYQRWKPNEPSNYATEDCLKVNHGSPGWNDEVCTRKRDYICEKFL